MFKAALEKPILNILELHADHTKFLDFHCLSHSKDNRTKRSRVFGGAVLWVGAGSWLGSGLGLKYQVGFWAVLDFFLLIILELQAGHAKFLELHYLSSTTIKPCGECGST